MADWNIDKSTGGAGYVPPASIRSVESKKSHPVYCKRCGTKLVLRGFGEKGCRNIGWHYKGCDTIYGMRKYRPAVSGKVGRSYDCKLLR